MENLIYEVIVGSTVYGTNMNGSDIDKKGVFQQPNEEILLFKYTPQINVTKDETYYEVQRFVELLVNANPTALELLFTPSEFILKTSPQIKMIIDNRGEFLTKKCCESFAKYGLSQIQKSQGLNKKMNWEERDWSKKTPLEFCYIHVDGKAVNLSEYLIANNISEKNCGFSNIDHFKNCFNLFFDETESIGFRGLVLDGANQPRLSSIPKGMTPIGIVSFNIEHYSKYCKEYKEYNDWLKNRNTNRYVDVKNHNQKIDGKNLLHCRRLIDIAIEIATNNTITLKSNRAEYLKSIRLGEVSLEEVTETSNNDILKLNELFKTSSLPDSVDENFVENLMRDIRFNSYGKEKI